MSFVIISVCNAVSFLWYSLFMGVQVKLLLLRLMFQIASTSSSGSVLSMNRMIYVYRMADNAKSIIAITMKF